MGKRGKTPNPLAEFDEDMLWGVTTNNDGEFEFESESDTDIARHFIEYMAEKGHCFHQK